MLVHHQVPESRERFNRGKKRPAIGKFRLHLLECQRVLVIHQLLVSRTVHPVESSIKCVVRLIMLVALDAPVAHIRNVASRIQNPMPVQSAFYTFR